LHERIWPPARHNLQNLLAIPIIWDVFVETNQQLQCARKNTGPPSVHNPANLRHFYNMGAWLVKTPTAAIARKEHWPHPAVNNLLSAAIHINNAARNFENEVSLSLRQ